MASKATQTVQVAFQQAAGTQQMDTGALVAELDALRSVSQTQVDALGNNTEAVSQNTASHSSGSGVGQTLASTLGQTALSMIPLVGIFSQLFGGSSQPETTAPLVKYQAPPSIQIDGTTAVSNGTPQAAPPVVSVPAPQSAIPPANVPAQSAAPQVTIQVQAMDSRSFMDHSQEIAQAVREAMLNMHSINDVVSDL